MWMRKTTCSTISMDSLRVRLVSRLSHSKCMVIPIHSVIIENTHNPIPAPYRHIEFLMWSSPYYCPALPKISIDRWAWASIYVPSWLSKIYHIFYQVRCNKPLLQAWEILFFNFGLGFQKRLLLFLTFHFKSSYDYNNGTISNLSWRDFEISCHQCAALCSKTVQ